jgi:hypothetical protein
MCIKIQKKMQISNPLKKDAIKARNEKVMENGIFYFYYCMQKFSAYNFFGVNFCAFCSADDTTIEFAPKKCAHISTFCKL